MWAQQGGVLSSDGLIIENACNKGNITANIFSVLGINMARMPLNL